MHAPTYPPTHARTNDEREREVGGGGEKERKIERDKQEDSSQYTKQHKPEHAHTTQTNAPVLAFTFASNVLVQLDHHLPVGVTPEGNRPAVQPQLSCNLGGKLLVRAPSHNLVVLFFGSWYNRFLDFNDKNQ